jgi:hypothetical protein
MLGHLGINVVELRAAKTHYDALLPLPGFTEFVSADDEFAGARAESLAPTCSSIRPPDWVAALGVHGHAPPYCATFWLDPWGNKLEAVCHYDRD